MADDRTVYKFEGDASGLIKASKKVESALGDVKKEAKKVDDALEDVETQTHKTAAGEVVLAGTSATASVGMMALAGAAAAAAIAIAAVAAVIVAIVVVLVAFAAGFIAAAVGVHKLITAADELYKEMEPLYKLGALDPVDEKQLKAIKEYTENWEALKVVFKDLLIAVAGNLAGDLESLSFEILVISIYLSDLAKDWLKTNSIIKNSIIEYLIGPIRDVQHYLRLVLWHYKPIIKAAEYFGIVSTGTWDKMAQGIETLDEKARKLVTTFVDKGSDYFVDQLGKMTSGMGAARKKAKKLKESLKEVGDTAGEAGEALEEFDPSKIQFDDVKILVDGSLEDVSGKMAGIFGDLAENMSDLTDPTGLFRDMLGEISDSLSVIAEADFSTLEGNLSAISAISKSVGNMMSSIINQQIRDNEELTDKQKKNLKILFAIQKVAAISSIIVDTASAIMRAYSELGPIAGGIAAGLIAGIGVAQTVVVASEQPPFHIGGVIPAAPGKQGVMINALPGESILNREATAGLGAEGVSALNSGAGMNGGITIEMVYKHRIFDNFVQQNISKGGPLRNAIKSGRRVGHR
jgi:hypothetical protein